MSIWVCSRCPLCPTHKPHPNCWAFYWIFRKPWGYTQGTSYQIEQTGLKICTFPFMWQINLLWMSSFQKNYIETGLRKTVVEQRKCRQWMSAQQCLANTLWGRNPPVWEVRLSKISTRDQLDSLHTLKLLLMLLHHKCSLHDLGSYLQPLNGFFTAWSEHHPFMKTGDRSSSAGQGWEGGGRAHSYQGIGHCGEIVMALTHICHSTIIIIVLKVGHVYGVQEGRKKRGKDTRQEKGKER